MGNTPAQLLASLNGSATYRRLFREADGKRVYLTDKELDEARARAKLSVDEYCS